MKQKLQDIEMGNGKPPMRKFVPIDKSPKKCTADCYLAPGELVDGEEKKKIVHAHRCPVALEEFNQGVNTRQVRRQYEREMEKRK